MLARRKQVARLQSRHGAGGAWLRIALSLLLMVLGPGCRIVQSAADLPGQTIRAITPGKKDGPAIDPVALQQTLLRFADEFSARLAVDIDPLQRGSKAPDMAEILRWKIALTSQTTAIASGPNAVADLLDMTVFVTVTRTALEEYWQPSVFGASALPLLAGCRAAETNIWRLADTLLKPEQQVELRAAIAAWYRQNPLPESVLAARAVGFAAQVAPPRKADAPLRQSVFSLLDINPLADLAPAVREVVQARMFAERALYVTQKMPLLMRWQIELLSVNAVGLPAVQQLVTNATQIAGSVERFATVAEQLPGQLSTERVALCQTLESQERQLTPLVNDVRQTLATGTQMSASLNTTLTTLDTVLKRFGVGEPHAASRPAAAAEPFRIQDYSAGAAQLEATARQLTELLVTLDQTLSSTNLAQLSAQVRPAVQQAQASGTELVDYAFCKGLLLIGVVFVAAFAYRLLTTRLIRFNSHSS